MILSIGLFLVVTILYFIPNSLKTRELKHTNEQSKESLTHINSLNTFKVEGDNKIKPTNASLDNRLLKTLIDNNWSETCIASILGNHETKISRPTDLEVSGPVLYYQTYYNQGIKIQLSDNTTETQHIYCLIFNSNYPEDILPNINMSSGLTQVQDVLGEPHFSDAELHLIGYKLKHFYVFFRGNNTLEEISVYSRRYKYDKNCLNTALKRYADTGIPSEFVQALWQDFDYSSGNSTYTYYNYDSRGVFVEITESGSLQDYVTLSLYGNYIGSVTDDLTLPQKNSALSDSINSTLGLSTDKLFINLLLDEDMVFNCEKERIIEVNEIQKRLLEDGELSSDGKTRLLYLFSMYTGNRLKLYNESNSEIFDEIWGVTHYDWLNGRYLIYDKNYRKQLCDNGIFVYDCYHKKEIKIAESIHETEINLLSIDRDIIQYKQNSEIHTIEHSFNKENGDIILIH